MISDMGVPKTMLRQIPYEFRKVDGVWQRRKRSRNHTPWYTLDVAEVCETVTIQHGTFRNGKPRYMEEERIVQVWTWVLDRKAA